MAVCLDVQSPCFSQWRFPRLLLFLSQYSSSRDGSLTTGKKQNVPHLKPTPIVGNYGDYLLQKKFFGTVTQEILRKFPKEPYVGAYYGTEPVLLVQDPEIVKIVTTKDFYYFHGREVTNYCHKELLTQNLFFVGGDPWKVTRQSLTPLFSSAKMKNMFHLIVKCSIEFEKLLDTEPEVRTNCEARMLMGRFTMACICACAFGVDIDAMGNDPESNTFIHIGQVIFDASRVRGAATVLRSIWPRLFYALGLKSFPQVIDDFFSKFMTNVFEERQYKPTTRNDFIDLFLQIRANNVVVGDSISTFKHGEGKKLEIEITNDYMIAQSILFFAAGYETSATTMSYTLYELAKNPEAMKKAQADVDAFLKRHDNKLVYECMTELPYVQACLDEALRLYPVLAVVTREVMEDYTFPTGLTVHKGVRVHIPIYHLHHNPDFFPEPHKFRPERFLAPEKDSIVPHSYIPFGDGGRICIGMRFAKLQSLAGLVTVLKAYNVSLAEGMPTKLSFNPRSIVTQPTEGVRLKFTPREGKDTRVFAK